MSQISHDQQGNAEQAVRDLAENSSAQDNPTVHVPDIPKVSTKEIALSMELPILLMTIVGLANMRRFKRAGLRTANAVIEMFNDAKSVDLGSHVYEHASWLRGIVIFRSQTDRYRYGVRALVQPDSASTSGVLRLVLSGGETCGEVTLSRGCLESLFPGYFHVDWKDLSLAILAEPMH